MRRMYGRGHLPSVDKDIMMEKVQKYLPDPLKNNPRFDIQIKENAKGTRRVVVNSPSPIQKSRSRSRSKSQKSDKGGQYTSAKRS